jgi:hypothetical protein
MSKDWLTKEEDLQAAAEIIDEYDMLNEGEPIALLNIVFKGEGKEFDVHVSDMVVDITDYFIKRYGVDNGRAIASKVLTKFLLAGHTIH